MTISTTSHETAFILPLTGEIQAWIGYLEATYDWVYIEVDVEAGCLRLERQDLIALVDVTRDEELLRAAFGAGRRRLLRQLGAKDVRRPL
jgi:hypothetical protein